MAQQLHSRKSATLPSAEPLAKIKMQNVKKIRGFNRISKKIKIWQANYLKLNINNLLDDGYEYVKIWVPPFSNLRYKERDYVGPKRRIRTEIVSSLIGIYENWQIQLEELGKPYYLKIWLYEPRITSSQVVCAIDERIDYYNALFRPEVKDVVFPNERYTSIETKLNEFKKQLFIDEEIEEDDNWPIEKWFSEEDYYWNKRYYAKLDKLNYRKEILAEGPYPPVTRYYIPKGNIWLLDKTFANTQ